MPTPDPDKFSDAILRDFVVLSKLDVARNQINASVRMLFLDWDIVSLHTVVCAAQEVLRPIAKKQGIRKSFKDNDQIPDEIRKNFSIYQNFFKHSSHDKDERLTFRYKTTPFFLFDAIGLYFGITNDLSLEMKIFFVWFQLSYPQFLNFKFAEELLKEIRTEENDPEKYKKLAARLLLQETSSKP